MVKGSVPDRVLFWMIALAIAYLFLRILMPVAAAVAAAAILAIAIGPLHQRLRRRLPAGGTGAALATMGIVFLLVGGPLAAAAWFVIGEAARAYMSARELLAGQPSGFGSLPLPGLLVGFTGLPEIDLRKILIDNLDNIGIPATRAAGTVLKNIGTLIAGFFVFVAMFFLFLRDGPVIVEAIERLLPLPAVRKAALLAKLSSSVEATVQVVFVIALLQGLLAALGLALFHVRFAALLGALCAVLSPIPFVGSALIWVPVVVKVALEGELSKAVMLGAWFILIVGLSDNVARPFFLRAKMLVPLPVIVLGVFGGLGAFGIAGAFFGPIIAAAALAWIETFSETE